jgi:hypothetical protein
LAGRVIDVEIPDLQVPKGANCGELVFNYAADERIRQVAKAQAAALHPAS